MIAAARGTGWLWPRAVDLHAYWTAGLAAPYGAVRPGEIGAYFYSPAFTQALEPLRVLPFPIVLGIWTGAALLVLRWATPLGWPLLLLIFSTEIVCANIHLFLAAMVVVGFRWPWTWSFALLTKVTPGVGLLWFAVRREWRSLVIALGATTAIAAASFALAPGLWIDYLRMLVSAQGENVATGLYVPIPIWVRLPLAALLVAWGARTDRRWTVAVAVACAEPVMWLTALSILVGIPILRRRQPTQTTAGAPARVALTWRPRLASAATTTP